jgi:tape measure domain-containing protein
MPSKTVQPIAIELGIKGGEKLAALNRSFRDLSKQTKLSDRDINQATKDIVKFAKEVGNSEATIKGQIKAFEGLRSQAAMGGKVYRELGKGIVDLKASLDGLGAKSQVQAKRLAEIGTSAKSSVSQIKDATEKLKLLSKEARTGSDAFARLKGDIAGMGEALEAAEGKAKKQREISNLLNGTLRKTSTLVGLQAKAYRERVAVTEKEIQSIDLLSSKERSTAANTEKRIRLEEKLQQQLLKVAQTGYLEFVASSRSETIKLAEAFSNTDKSIASFGVRLKALDKDFGKLPNTTAGLNQKLAELKIELNNTVRSSSDYTRVSNEIIGIQKELSKETGESAQAFERLNRAQEGAERRAAKLAGAGEYVAGLSSLGAGTATRRPEDYATSTRPGEPLVGQMRSRQGRPQGYRDPASGAMIAPGSGTRQSKRLFNQTYKTKEETQKLAAEQKNLESVFDSVIDSYRQGLEKIQQQQQKRHDDLMSQVAEEDAAQQESFNEQVKREENAFQQELKRRDILLQARKSAESALGLGGRDDISSLYQGIIGLSTADIRRQQQMMGKSATDVFNDIATGFSKGGQAVDLKGKSTDIGDSIAEGVSKGASSSNEISKGAKSFAEKLINAYKAAFGIKSPSKRTEQKIGVPLGLGIIRGLLSALKSGKKEVQREIESIADPVINKSRQPRRLIGTVNQPIATFTGYGSQPRPADQGYRPLGKSPVNLNSEIDRMFDRFRASIAALTTDAEIYYNLLQRLPTSRITTTLADLANKRSTALQVSGFMETQRQIGPGDLEREIASSVAGYMKELRAPNPWVGIAGDYKKFINSVSTETRRLRNDIPALPPSKVAGLLPPAAGLTPAQQARASAAYGRSDERSRRVFEEDALRGNGQPRSLSSGAGGRGGGPAKTAAASAGSSFEELNTTLLKFGRLSDRSTADVRELGASLGMLGDTLSPLDADFKKVNRAIADQSRLIEKELEKRNRTRRRFSPGKAAQVAGATISGGIFGGPEGFLGGAIGGAIGGVGGSFAGAALGAQVGQLRQQLGGFAEYAAQIDKLKISLKGITQSGLSAEQGLAQYNLAIATAADVTESLNVPQDTAIAGITRLTAAVKGAGGNVNDASIAFKNINSAIIATGGGAEQVEGAVTALVQIFSKGKVSAEEINQIAERLPGTFNLFAEAAGKTGPQLADSLKKGEVGLNDLQKFVKLLGDDFGDLAEKIADSPQAAGARLKVVTDQLRKDIGDALQPIGAEFQQAFAEFISDIGPDLVKTAKAVGEGMRFILRNRAAIGTAAALAAKLFLVSKAMKLIAGLKLATIASLAGTGTAAKITGDVSGVAAGKVALLGKALRSLAAIGIVTVGVEYVVNNARVLASNTKRLEELRGRRDQGAAARFEGETYEGGLARQKAAQQTIEAIDKEYPDLEKRVQVFEAVRGGSLFTRGQRKRLAVLKARRIEAQQNLSLPLPEKPQEQAQTVFNNLLDETKDKSGGGGGGGKAEKVRKSLLDSIINEGKLIAATKARLANEIDIGEAQNKNNRSRVNQLNNQRITIDFAEQAAQVELKYLEALKAAEGQKERGALVAEAVATKQNDDARLSIEYAAELTKEAQRYRFEKEAIAKASEDELFNLRDQLGLVTKKQKIDRFRQSRIDAGDPNAEQQTDLFRQTIDPTLTEGLSQNIRSLKKELEDLVNPINQITGAANAIGSAFSQSFTNAITGATSAKQALSDFFKSVASYFLDMAGQIIAKMVTIAILNTALSLLPGASGPGAFNLSGGGSNVGSGSLPGISGPEGLFNGSLPFVGSSTNILGRANGGPVSANTPYIVGERGPELMVPSGNGTIIPNDVFSASRAAISGGGPLSAAGNSGDLGKDGMVESRNYISNNYSTQQAIAQSQAAVSSSSMSMERVIERKAAERQATEMSEPIRVKLDTTVINNVEYLTVEQGLALSESASRKARSQVFSDLRQRPASRSKVGLG